MKPDLSCCEAHRVPFPSGWAWAHADSCPVRPRQKVEPGEDHPSRWRGRSSWWAPRPYAGKDAEVLAWKAHTGRWA